MALNFMSHMGVSVIVVLPKLLFMHKNVRSIGSILISESGCFFPHRKYIPHLPIASQITVKICILYTMKPAFVSFVEL
jgi:hypothetical protein